MPVPSGRPKPSALWPSGKLRPEGPPGWVTPQATCCGYQTPGGASHPRGRQESDWLSLCLSSCPKHQPCGTQRCTGSLLSHIDGADTHVPPILLITRGFPHWATICFRSSSCTGAWALPQAQKATTLPRPCGQHASWWDHIQGNCGGAP